MSSGGLAHVIFNLPTRITLCEHIALYRRVAKLKMLCLMRGRRPGQSAVRPTAHNVGALCSNARSGVELTLGLERGEQRFNR
jgi:hypothetical protein